MINRTKGMFLSSILHLLSSILHLLSSFFFLAVVALMLLLSPAAPVQAQNPQPDDIIEGVRFEQKLNEQVPLELTFQDEAGRTVPLGDYFGQKPVILVFAYYDCPMLCTLVLNGLLDSLQEISFNPGQEFEVVTISIDPNETPELAADKKDVYLTMYGRPGVENGWHFLTGDESSIQPLAEAAGFFYQYDAERDEYAHPTGIMILTPAGKIARYFYGIKYPPTDVRLGLVEAAAGQIGSPVDQLLLTCYHYDPALGKYNVVIMDVIRLAGLSTTGILAAVIGAFFWRERRKKPGG